MKHRIFLFALLFTLSVKPVLSQDLLDMLDEGQKPPVNYTAGTFKATHIVIGQSVENTPKGNMEFLISHHFGRINGGLPEPIRAEPGIYPDRDGVWVYRLADSRCRAEHLQDHLGRIPQGEISEAEFRRKEGARDDDRFCQYGCQYDHLGCSGTDKLFLKQDVLRL